jgi:hypothetical protein
LIDFLLEDDCAAIGRRQEAAAGETCGSIDDHDQQPLFRGRVLDFMAEAADPISEIANAPVPPRVGSEDWSAFVTTIGDLRTGRAGWPAELEFARLWYEPHLDRIHEDAVVRRSDLIQLEQIASGYPSRERFLTEPTLDRPDATGDQPGVPLLDEDYLILSTIHSAKGQEWKSVFVLNVVDGYLPSDLGTGKSAEIEEERPRFAARYMVCMPPASTAMRLKLLPLSVVLIDPSETRSYPPSAGRGHSEPAGKVNHVP